MIYKSTLDLGKEIWVEFKINIINKIKYSYILLKITYRFVPNLGTHL